MFGAADGIDTVTTDSSISARITGSANKICLSEVTHLSEECCESDIALSHVAERTTPAKDEEE